ncbi:sugar kinase [Streptomyces sp. NBC_00690]|uniref:sugar kinase n=1 Tax=Streptomyces sp. NBC_00690 TaxID=2975808 RepID=UPI002E298CEC|nr:sugar kinase [Streptomyces sp. NBC_00690]
MSSPTGTATVATTDVICLGESMVTFLPSRPGRLADVPSFARAIGGAESNVACALAAAGHRVRWVSRVGRDGFGDHLIEAISSYGVDTSAVGRDPRRPTGIYFRTATDRSAATHEVVYYRAGSAASAMSPATVPAADLSGARVLHLSGITAALSDDCLALMRELTAPRPGRPLISFDINHRPGLWADDRGAEVLLELARGADLVFVGEDEAEHAWGLRGARAIRDALPQPALLVVKQGGKGAVVFAAEGDERLATIPATGPEPGRKNPTVLAFDGTTAEQGRGSPVDSVTFVPAPRVEIVAAVGAGDAFAAGFLSATLRGLPIKDRIRHGHLMAAAALTVPGDVGQPPATARADALVALDDADWERLRLGPGWTSAVDEEVRTP